MVNIVEVCVLLVISVFVQTSFACVSISLTNILITNFTNLIISYQNGYKATVKKIKNCAGDDGIIQFADDFDIKLNKKCELVPSGCIMNKAFNTAKVHFKLKKDGVVMKEDDVDLCAAAEKVNAEAKNFMKVFAVPESCPVSDGKVCANEHKVDISKYKNLLSLAKGSIQIDATIDHDTGKSCLHADLEVTK